MTPPYRPSQGDPTSRFVLFVAAFLIIVGIGSQASQSSASIKSMCFCVPARAGLIMKSALARTQARSTKPLTARATVTQ